MPEKILKVYKESIEKNELSKIEHSIEEICENEKFLGKGKAARVFTCGEESYCIKEITDANPEYSFNGIDQEMEMQIEAIKLGVRAPLPILILQTEKGRKFIAMERIFGNSLKDVDEGRAPLPEDFNREMFVKELENTLKKMHENNFYHRDLHSGNVMFESKNGKYDPVIIDFGHSNFCFGVEDPYREENFPKYGSTKIFPNDDFNLRDLRNLVLVKLTN